MAAMQGREIEDFLRRAAQRPQQPPPRPQRPSDQEPIEAEIVEDRPVGYGVPQQVEKYLDTSEFRQRSEQLGEEVSQADEAIEQHLKEKFSGEVSHLAAQAKQTDIGSRSPTEAAALEGTTVDILGSPTAILNAIIMQEILRRPKW